RFMIRKPGEFFQHITRAGSRLPLSITYERLRGEMTRILTLLFSIALFMNYGRAQTAEGKRPYQARCAGCHGEDGPAAGPGPGIVDVRRSRATSQETVRDLILKGIPGGGMPAFEISGEEASAIAAYVMRLKQPVGAGAAAGVVAPGDGMAGEQFFAGKGKCS